jgi:hypothetical protein
MNGKQVCSRDEMLVPARFGLVWFGQTEPLMLYLRICLRHSSAEANSEIQEKFIRILQKYPYIYVDLQRLFALPH